MAKIDDKVRNHYMELVEKFLVANDEEVLQVKTNIFSIPWVDGEEEGYINITFSIPKGQRGGEGYDGHEEAENFKIEQKVKLEKKMEKEEAKKKKIERDKKRREKEGEN